ncbi:lysis system i-spanin subunit Rz [Xylophilus rhododendri]|uniref:lysis system i-spanin subunit Rz n=1 Tax=Xylophilus rhododendri TaxID=2697032 RepID=UPI001E5E0DF6|nr:lysis system i-spanin subunit Rz [Xylophilus rhododendri]
MNPLNLIAKVSPPACLWIVGGLIAISGVLYVRLQVAEKNLAQFEARTAMAGSTAQRQINEKHETQAAAVAASDITRTQELSNAKAEIDSHRAPVASGAERVRVIAARCPAGGGDVPAAAGAAGLDDAAPVELAAAGGQLVLDLKAAIAADQVKIRALQDYVMAIQK